jgi:hypothetical protein
MPRTKYTQPPGPFPPSQQIRREKFRFSSQERRALAGLLPDRMNKLTVPDDDRIKAARLSYKLKTMADLVVYETEALIAAHLTAAKLSKGARVPSPANVGAAIRRLRTALNPFLHGWVDDKTASLIPARLDDRLAVRARELESMKVRSVKQRLLGIVCQSIAAIVRRYAKANKAHIEKRNVREFVAQALDFAGIEYPDPKSHPERLDKLILPPQRTRPRQNAG